MFHKMDVHQPQSIFRYLPILSFAESFIYQVMNEHAFHVFHCLYCLKIGKYIVLFLNMQNVALVLAWKRVLGYSVLVS